MFEIGWSEILIIAIVVIIVVGPKDLPAMLRTFGRTMTQLRRMAGEFRSQFDEAIKEAELDEVKKTFDDARRLNPAREIRDAMNPLRKVGDELKADIDRTVRGAPEKPDSSQATLAKKDGAAKREGAAGGASAPARDAVRAEAVGKATDAPEPLNAKSAAPRPTAGKLPAASTVSRPAGAEAAKAAPVKAKAANTTEPGAKRQAAAKTTPSKAAAAGETTAAKPAAKKAAGTAAKPASGRKGAATAKSSSVSGTEAKASVKSTGRAEDAKAGEA